MTPMTLNTVIIPFINNPSFFVHIDQACAHAIVEMVTNIVVDYIKSKLELPLHIPGYQFYV
jgi:hypothetical protein